MACYNGEFCSRLIADGFAYSFGQHKSVKRALAFGVSACWSRNAVYWTAYSSSVGISGSLHIFIGTPFFVK